MTKDPTPSVFPINSMLSYFNHHHTIKSSYLVIASTANSPSTFILLPNFSKTCRGSIFKKKKLFNFVSKKVVSCKANNEKQNNADSSLNGFDRRDILLGLGGSFYGATNLLGGDPFTLAAAIVAPDLSHCAEATVQPTGGVQTTMGIDCCPPYLKKFEEALRLMRELDKDDPRSFMQQANVHCATAYCNDAYPQTLFPSQPIQFHNSWLFSPFHRLYMYSFEKILGKLINDPDFAIPYWNWDSPSGMSMTEIYVGSNSPLYDSKRDLSHLPPSKWYTPRTLLFSLERRTALVLLPTQERVPLRTALTLPFTFGSVTRKNPIMKTLGNFYSAGRDPIFYAHHAKCGPNVEHLEDNTGEEAAPLGYDYQSVDIPWLGSKATPRRRGWASRPPPPPLSGRAPGQAMAVELHNTIAFPIVLDKIVRFKVPRPKKSRTKIGKKDEEKVFVIENIQLDKDAPVKFDVCTNDDDDEDDGKPVGMKDSKFVGSFTNLPHGHGQPGAKLTTTLTFSILDSLEELGIDGEDNIVVTLVPQEGEAC
ncbi:hypothetical protein CXB51_015887 [Gossypium anomalum]|uniref:Tyrosinase copper-binding domain-containing protein n=1 Tax=Gossypium anomalum TaxID=47600 RepID=A0A8J6CZF7_9ROSI|nr:hypothetical protein CXB51_015887 [Gossypium anomalum]